MDEFSLPRVPKSWLFSTHHCKVPNHNIIILFSIIVKTRRRNVWRICISLCSILKNLKYRRKGDRRLTCPGNVTTHYYQPAKQIRTIIFPGVPEKSGTEIVVWRKKGRISDQTDKVNTKNECTCRRANKAYIPFEVQSIRKTRSTCLTDQNIRHSSSLLWQWPNIVILFRSFREKLDKIFVGRTDRQDEAI